MSVDDVQKYELKWLANFQSRIDFKDRYGWTEEGITKQEFARLKRDAEGRIPAAESQEEADAWASRTSAVRP